MSADGITGRVRNVPWAGRRSCCKHRGMPELSSGGWPAFRRFGSGTLYVLALLGLAVGRPALGACGVNWAVTNSFGQRDPIENLTEMSFLEAGGCLNWANLVNPDAPVLGWSIAYGQNSYLGYPGPVEFGALSTVVGSASPQVFDVYVFYRYGGYFGTPPADGHLEVRMREALDPNQEGWDEATEVPLVGDPNAIAQVGASLGQEVCWRHARIQLQQPVPGGDYWFCVRWNPGNASDTFTLAYDADPPHDGLIIFDDGYWRRGDMDPMIVVLQDASANEPPTAVINAPDAGGTGFPFTLDGSGSTAGLGPNCSTNDWITSRAWSLIAKPGVSQLPWGCAAFDDCTAESATFIPDAPGLYRVQLIVNDRYEAGPPVVHTINVTQTPPPDVEPPQISRPCVHAEDYGRDITLSVTVTDQDPNFVHVYDWTIRHTVTGDEWTSQEEEPTLTISDLPDDGSYLEDTDYDVTVAVTNTHPDPHLTTTSASSRLTISRWPPITLHPGQARWGHGMTYDLPVTVGIHAGCVGLDTGGTTLLLMRPDGNVYDSLILPDPSRVEADQYVEYTLSVHKELNWDPTGGCLLPTYGPSSETLSLTAALDSLQDDNHFWFNNLTAITPTERTVSVPDQKTTWYRAAFASMTMGLWHSVEATHLLLEAPKACALVAAACGPFYAACFGGCMVGMGASAAFLYGVEAWELHEHIELCDKAHNDPPEYDPDYAVAVPLDVSEIDTTAALAPDEPTRLAMVAAQRGAVFRAVDLAYSLTYNKLFGAYQALQAGDPNAYEGTILQGTELVRWGGAWGRELDGLQVDQMAAQDACTPPTIDDVMAYQQQVAAEGLPQREIDVLVQLGADQELIDAIAAEVVAADASAIASGIPDDYPLMASPSADLYESQSWGVVPGGLVLVAITEPWRDWRVRGVIDIDARVVHKKETSMYCACGPTLVTDVQIDGQPPFSSVPYPPPPYCPPPPVPWPQAVPTQLDTSTLPDGPHVITVTARDSLQCQPQLDPREHLNVDTITIFVDNTPPTLIITSPDADPDAPGIQVLAGDEITYLATDPQVNGYTSGLVDPGQGVFVTDPGFGHEWTIRVADRAGNTNEATVEVVSTPEGQVVTIGNATQGDGHLQLALDEYGSLQAISANPNQDLYDPVGAATERSPTYSSVFYLFVGDVSRELLSASAGWQDHVWPDGSAFSDDGSMERVVTATPAAGDSTPGDGIEDTLTSAFTVLGMADPNHPAVLTFELTQFVSESDPPGTAYLRQDYRITNQGGQPVTLRLVRVYDGDMPWSGDPVFADDWVGAGQNWEGWYAYQQEPDDDRLAVTLSSFTSPDAYFGGKHGVDPDGSGGDPPFGWGTSVEIWDAYGVPTAWQDYVAGVGYNIAGVSGSNPPGSVPPADGFVGLQFELTLQPDEQTPLTLVHSYGTTRPLLLAGEPCPGDLDGDRDVDLTDLARLLADYGTTGGATYEDGDLDGDGDVDLSDLAALLSVYGTACP
jgi:hypothetical protein